jgi:hypothetical protein
MISIATPEAMPQSSVKGRAATQNKVLARTNGSAIRSQLEADEHTYGFGKFATLKTHMPKAKAVPSGGSSRVLRQGERRQYMQY